MNALLWCLRVGTALMCVGAAMKDLYAGGPIFDYLFLGWGLEDQTATLFVNTGSYVMLACLPFLLFRRGWPVLLLISAWFGLRMATMWWDDVWFPLLIPAENAVRYLGPLALAGLLAFPRNGSIPAFRRYGMTYLLRVAAAATFVGHGLAALYHKGVFVDYIIAAGRDLIGLTIPQATAETMLTGIGTLDCFVAVGILLPYGLRYVSGWMAFWGLLTAFVRIIRLGEPGVPLMLIRGLNWAVPLGLCLYWILTDRKTINDHEPNNK